MSTPDLIVYHDGSCPLCQLEIGHYRRRRGAERIDFVDVSPDDADPGPGLDRSSAMKRFHVRLSSGELKSGADAFVTVWENLPRWRLAGRLARLSGMAPALEAGYRLRSRSGRGLPVHFARSSRKGRRSRARSTAY